MPNSSSRERTSHPGDKALYAVTGDTLVAAPGGGTVRAPGLVRRRLAPYARLFSRPGTVAFTAGNLIARLPMGMFTVSAVLMIAGARGSYALAGAVTAAGLAMTAVVAPLTARLTDRYGQSRIAVPAAVFAVTGWLSLAACVRLGAPDWTLFASCAATATAPNTGGMSRARWSYLYRDDPAARHTANSFEQAADELCFMAGPALAALLCTALFPEAGTLTGAVLLLTGIFLFAARRDTEPPPAGPGLRDNNPALRRLLPFLLTFVSTGAVFGSLEVITLGYADAQGHKAAGGAVIAFQAAGSAMAGLLYGTLPVRGPAPRRFLLCVCAMALLMLLPLLAAGSGSLLVLAPALLVAGMATAPTMVTAMTLIQERVPAERLNEGMTLAVTALLAGTAAGAATGGPAAEHLTGGLPYVVPAGAALIAAATAVASVAHTRGE